MKVLKGLIEAISIMFVVAVVGLFLFGLVLQAIRAGEPDDSDSSDRRSGMDVLRDNLTGCEYLATIRGLTPRLDANGRQVCREAPQ